MKKYSVESKINGLLDEWTNEELQEFFRYIEYMLELCTVGNDGRTVVAEFDKKDDNEKNTLRLVRLAYTLSRMSESFAGKFALCKIKYKNLWQEMEAEFPVK